MAESKQNTKSKKKLRSANVPDLIEVCRDDSGKIIFLLHNEGDLGTVDAVKIGKQVFYPPGEDDMPWVLPNAERIISHYRNDNDADLFNDIVKMIQANCELPEPHLDTFLAAWVLHTHVIKQFIYSPILIFFAVAARGKTRAGSLILWMSRRGFHVETVREADIIRKAERFCAAFFFDISDIWKKARSFGSQDILLGRFCRGIKISRVTHPEIDGFGDTKHFSCFGPTIIASNESPSDILLSRGITIKMRESERIFENDLIEENLLELRERCIAFQARWFYKSLPEVKKPARHRLGDILRPIAQIITAIVPDKIDQFNSLIPTFQDDISNSLADTPEGRTIKCLLDNEHEVKSSIILTSIITRELNFGQHERFKTSPGSVGKRMASLGFKATKSSGERGFIYDEKILFRLAEQYGVSKKTTKADEADRADKLSDDDDDDKMDESDKILFWATSKSGD